MERHEVEKRLSEIRSEMNGETEPTEERSAELRKEALTLEEKYREHIDNEVKKQHEKAEEMEPVTRLLETRNYLGACNGIQPTCRGRKGIQL